MFLKLRGMLGCDRTHPESPERPDADREVLNTIARDLEKLLGEMQLMAYPRIASFKSHADFVEYVRDLATAICRATNRFRRVTSRRCRSRFC